MLRITQAKTWDNMTTTWPTGLNYSIALCAWCLGTCSCFCDVLWLFVDFVLMCLSLYKIWRILCNSSIILDHKSVLRLILQHVQRKVWTHDLVLMKLMSHMLYHYTILNLQNLENSCFEWFWGHVWGIVGGYRASASERSQASVRERARGSERERACERERARARARARDLIKS